VWEAKDVARIPTAALTRDGDAWSVYVVESGRAVTRRVQIGERSDEDAQLLAGLKPGDRVVVYPGDRVVSGARVEVR
jgi:HlyD family secretion protein